MFEDENAFMKTIGEMFTMASDPNLTDDEKENIFYDKLFGQDQYDDVKIGDKYYFHTAKDGLFNGQAFEMKVSGLFNNCVYLSNNTIGMTGTHSIEEFRGMIYDGTYAKKEER